MADTDSVFQMQDACDQRIRIEKYESAEHPGIWIFCDSRSPLNTPYFETAEQIDALIEGLQRVKAELTR